ncbi:uncharacterized protein TNCT_605491 [Trichonephila clavata]|uniref:Uncharacterized protein n=1 Tax=Trichonephila clavata TaxID=2740835 RepID=A0A8X6EZX7_TRICU|nr:uncharacterized protein TNCT_605491 [Trichonephila clavata]
MYPDEYLLDPENAEIYEESYVLAVRVKEIFYECVFYEEFRNVSHEFEYSPTYIFEYVSRTCRRDGVFRDLTIFELFFTSCAFVSCLGLYCFHNCAYKDVIGYAHLCWAVYFDEYKEEFYKQGGWSKLKAVAAFYVPAYEFLFTFPNGNFRTIEGRQAYLLEVMKAVNNYKTAVDTNCKTISKAWVKLHLPSLSKFDANDVTEDVIQNTRNPKVIEEILLKFRCICDPVMTKWLNESARYKQFTDDISRSSLKLNNFTLNDMTANTCDTEFNQINMDPPIQENNYQMDKIIEILSGVEKGDDQSNELVVIDLAGAEKCDDQANKMVVIDISGVEKVDDQTNELVLKNVSRNKENTSSYSENVSFLKGNFTNVSQNKTQNASEQKLSNEIKTEIDLERNRPEVKCLLGMILALGDRQGIAVQRSLLPCLHTHQQKVKSKKK